MKKGTKRILFLMGASVAAIYAYNKYIERTATQKKLLSMENGNIFSWKDEEIFYTKTGSGSPLLLIHDADPASSSEEWCKIIRRFEKHHTVYCLDLLGCGRSDKPNADYSNYFFNQMITAFVKDVICEKTIVVASNLSASFVFMANHLDGSLFEKMIFINPASIKSLQVLPDTISKAKKTLLELPFIGTFVYNILTNSRKIENDFQTKYYSRPQLASTRLKETYYEAAHTSGSNGRFLYSSLIGNYMSNPITHAIKKIETPTLIIGCKELPKYEFALNNYHKVNPRLSIIRLNSRSLYPQLEIPEKISGIIEDYLFE